MIREIIYRLKIKKLDEIHIKQYLERKGYEVVINNSERGQHLINKLKIDNPTDSSFVYDKNNLKYVFLAQTKNEDDKLMVLLHESGHIEYNHQINSKYNEAQAWNFAYNSYNIFNILLKFIIIIFLLISMSLVIAGTFKKTTPILSPAPTSTQNDVIPTKTSASDAETEMDSEIVYVTHSGTRFHLSGCRYIKGKDVMALNRDEASNHYTPCKVCQP